MKIRYYVEEHVLTKPSTEYPSIYVHGYPKSICGIINRGGPYKCRKRAMKRYNKIKLRGIKTISDNYKHVYALLKSCTDKDCNTITFEEKNYYY